MDERLMQFLKASLPIDVTPDWIVINERLPQKQYLQLIVYQRFLVKTVEK